MAKRRQGRVNASRKRRVPLVNDSSKRLHDPMRELFAQELAAGAELYQAFEAAGFRRPAGNAQAMRAEADVSARVDYLIKRTEPLDDVMREYRRAKVRNRLDNIVDLDRLSLLEEFIFRKKRGLRLKALGDLTAQQRALIEGFEMTRGGSVKVVMPSKLAALAQQARLDGLDRPVKVASTDPSGENVVAGPVINLYGRPEGADGPSSEAA